jgi:hypothetical protein
MVQLQLANEELSRQQTSMDQLQLNNEQLSRQQTAMSQLQLDNEELSRQLSQSTLVLDTTQQSPRQQGVQAQDNVTAGRLLLGLVRAAWTTNIRRWFWCWKTNTMEYVLLLALADTITAATGDPKKTKGGAKVSKFASTAAGLKALTAFRQSSGKTKRAFALLHKRMLRAGQYGRRAVGFYRWALWWSHLCETSTMAAAAEGTLATIGGDALTTSTREGSAGSSNVFFKGQGARSSRERMIEERLQAHVKELAQARAVLGQLATERTEWAADRKAIVALERRLKVLKRTSQLQAQRVVGMEMAVGAHVGQSPGGQSQGGGRGGVAGAVAAIEQGKFGSSPGALLALPSSSAFPPSPFQSLPSSPSQRGAPADSAAGAAAAASAALDGGGAYPNYSALVVECTLLQRQLHQFRGLVNTREKEIKHLFNENETMRAKEEGTREKAAGAALEMMPISEEEVGQRRVENGNVRKQRSDSSVGRTPKAPWRSVLNGAENGEDERGQTEEEEEERREGREQESEGGESAEVHMLQRLRGIFDAIEGSGADGCGFVSRRALILALRREGRDDSELCKMLGLPAHIRQVVPAADHSFSYP